MFEGVNPQGCEVTSFKQPSTKELDHDFLWRSMIALPERGRIGIFNRSYYEECLVVRVHPEILAKQKIPQRLVTKDIWRDRFEDISAMENYLARNGTVILKFFLNVSKEEQRERFLERLEEPAKNWKFSLADIAERKLWAKYQAAYQDLIRHTSTRGSALARRARRPQMVRPRGDRLGHRKRARQARSAFPQSRQGRPQRIQAGPRGAAGGGEGDEEVGWVERSETHHYAGVARGDGFRCALPILRAAQRRVVIPREGGESSTPRPLGPSSGLWDTGSPAGACHRAAVRPTRWRVTTGINYVSPS